jgi:hypothetical protein
MADQSGRSPRRGTESGAMQAIAENIRAGPETMISPHPPQAVRPEEADRLSRGNKRARGNETAGAIERTDISA